eukprot:2143926-Pleurochrysis_carterae.AAC.1
MPAVDVLGALVMLRIVGQVDCRLVVHGQAGGLALRQSEFREKGSQVHSLLSGLGRRDNFCFA